MKIRIVGAGYGGVRAALDLDKRFYGRNDVHITLINPHPYHQLITESHKPAAGSVGSQALTIPLDDLFGGTAVETMQGTVTDVGVGKGQLVVDRRKILKFDFLILAPGSRPEFFSIPGVAEHCLTIQGVNSADIVKHHIESMFARAQQQPTEKDRRPYLTIVIVGGGFTGVELAGELADRIPTLAERFGFSPRAIRLVTIEAAFDIMPGFAEPLVDTAVETLLKKGVSIEMGVPIVQVEPDRVLLKDGRHIEARTIIWTGGVRAHPLIERRFSTGVRGRAVVNEHLQSVDDASIYIIGDAALAVDKETGRPVPPTAQHAIEQGRIAARNVWAAANGRAPDVFLNKAFGIIATVGRDVGLANIGGYKLAGRLPAVMKDVSTLRYIYSLGGPRLLFKFMSRHWPALLFR